MESLVVLKDRLQNCKSLALEIFQQHEQSRLDEDLKKLEQIMELPIP